MDEMDEPCELLERCGFFLNFTGNTEVIKRGWIQMFCESKAKSEKCKRKLLRRQTGQPPPDNMAPTGQIIETIDL